MASINMNRVDPELSEVGSFIMLHARTAATLVLCARLCKVSDISDNEDGDYAGEPSGAARSLSSAETLQAACQRTVRVSFQIEHDADDGA